MESASISKRKFRVDGRVFAIKLAIYWVTIGLGIWLGCLDGWRYSIVSVLLIGAMFAHGVELQHQALHGTAFNSRLANRVAGFLLGLPMLVSFFEYQKSHLLHHRKIGTTDDRESFDYDYGALRKPLEFVMHLFMLRYYKAKLKKLCEAAMPAAVRDLWSARIRGEYRLMLAALIIAVGLSIAARSMAVVWFWLLPLLLVAAPIHALIEFPEHVGCRSNTTDLFQNTRTIAAGRFARWFTNGNNFHVEHHWHAGVQVERWPELHSLLRHRIQVLEPSYWAFYRRFWVALRTKRVSDPSYWTRNAPTEQGPAKTSLPWKLRCRATRHKFFLSAVARKIASALFCIALMLWLVGCSRGGTNTLVTSQGPTNPPVGNGTGGASATLTFPVPTYQGQPLNAHNAPIVTVFDHHFTRPYGNDGVIIAFTGDRADQNPCPIPGSSNVLGRAGGLPFDFGTFANYVGYSPCNGVSRLSYDDHPGYDYRFQYDTPIFPAIHGQVSYAIKPNGVNTQDAIAYHTLTITSADGSMQVRYLHLATWWDAATKTVLHRKVDGTEEECLSCPHEGDTVDPKQANPIGYTGDFSNNQWHAVGPHLHFEVSDGNRNPMDPYGWVGSGADPCGCGHNLWDLSTTNPIAAFSISGGGKAIKNGESATFQVAPGNKISFNFDGSASVPQAGAISTFAWQIDGTLVSQSSQFSLTLGAGTHVVQLTVTNTAGGSNSATAAITITEVSSAPPSVSISSPGAGAIFSGGQSITFTGSATDLLDGVLTGAALRWTSSADGLIGTGNSFSRSDLTAGNPTITLTATDSQGRTASTSVAITITASIKTLANGLNHPWACAVDDQSVFWVENNVVNGAVKSVPKTGGTITTLATGVEPDAIAVDSNNVYWIERNNGDNGSVRSIPKTGGIPQTLVTGLHNAQNFLALDDQFLYFGDGQPGGGGALRKIAKTGGSLITLVNSGLPNLTTAVAVDTTFVYFTDGIGHLLRIPKSGGNTSIVANADPSAIVVQNGQVYWVDFSGNKVQSVSASGGTVTTLSTDTISPSNLAVDAQNVYWIEFNFPGNVKSVPLNGGTDTTLATQANTIGIAVDSTNVYWVEGTFIDQGKINTRLKP